MGENNNEKDVSSGSDELSEDQLETVAGGVGASVIPCYFEPKGRSKEVSGATWLECNASCGFYKAQCGCRFTEVCVDRWHKLESDKTLAPVSVRGHSLMKPPTYKK